jgi:hypothetical protein
MNLNEHRDAVCCERRHQCSTPFTIRGVLADTSWSCVHRNESRYNPAPGVHKCTTAPLLVLVLLLLTCCEQHPIVRDTPQDFISFDDSCGNYYPPYADMGFKPANEWPFLAEAAGGQVSPDGNYLAYRGMNTDYLQHGHSFPISGLAVMGLRSNSHLLFIRAGGLPGARIPDASITIIGPTSFAPPTCIRKRHAVTPNLGNLSNVSPLRRTEG